MTTETEAEYETIGRGFGSSTDEETIQRNLTLTYFSTPKRLYVLQEKELLQGGTIMICHLDLDHSTKRMCQNRKSPKFLFNETAYFLDQCVF